MSLRAFQVVSSAIGIAAATISFNHVASAVSPATIEQGRQLFERTWRSGNPAFGSDGLGPLFNARSCVACHHQGGVGGSGSSEFNSHSIGIEEIRIAGRRVDDEMLRQVVRTIHPGFVQGDRKVVAT